MTDTLTGQKIGKYTLAEKLGRGGMAEVYKAYQENLDRYVAIKLMHTFLASEEDFLHRFKREARAMAALNHPNIVGIIDFDVWKNDIYYLVMEYISGGTLKEHLETLANNGETMPLEQAVSIARQMASALAYAHKRNMVHRDIKPANIMLDETGRAILTDFGIVKLMGAQSMAYTATGALIGTPSYMSPEQAMGRPGDERCDIYSLGVLLFQMTTGQLPFAADTPLAVVMKHVNEPVPLPTEFNPSVPVDLQRVILKALAKNPDERYQTAAEFEEALGKVDLNGGTAVSPQATALSATAVSPTKEETGKTILEKTPAETAVVDKADSAEEKTAVSTTEPAASARPKWVIPAVILAVLALLAGGAFAFGGFGGGNGEEGTAVAVVGNDATETPAAADTQTATPVIDETDVAATVETAVRLTEEAAPTNTPTPSPTPTKKPTATPTNTPTPDPTLVFLASCTTNAELVLSYPYNYVNRPDIAVPINGTFSYHWVLKNTGTCPWPDDLVWEYVDGTQFGYDDGPIPLETAVTAGETITLTASLTAPPNINTYESIWQLKTSDGEPFAPEMSFKISTYLPATPTPAATPTPQATPTPDASTLPEVNYLAEYVANTCEYQGGDWQCQFKITAYGGGGGPYTVFVFDQPAGQATEFRGGSVYYYFPKARRCVAFNANVRVIDEASGTIYDRHLYVHPNDYFNCQE
jgi:serine/threonine-protein kinase